MNLRLVIAIIFAWVALGKCDPNYQLTSSLPKSSTPQAAYPDWAHDHWVWLSSPVANQNSMLQLVKDYQKYDIPVGAVDLDSMWSTGVNNFKWDTNKYPNATWMIEQFHSMGIRVILWVTSMVDSDSDNYQYAYEHLYLLNDGELIKWWHGKGALFDYTNPNGLKWWHSQLQSVLDQGIDGWKCDGTDPFIYELVVPIGYAGIVSPRDYANMYYRDFLYYSRKTNPNALIMSRPVDSYGPIYWQFSPRDVVLSGWVGDQDPTFDGLQRALENYFHSAWDGYVNFGSDIGGYRTGPGVLGRTKELFIRWAQLGAFSPLMENGGNKEHRPWMFDDETLQIYRNFVKIHMSLKPYFLTVGSNALASNYSAITPMSKYTFVVTNWNYLLGPDVFVAPIVKNSTARSVEFPAGSDWADWWNSSLIYRGGSTAELTVPLASYPVFKRVGSLIPMNFPDTDLTVVSTPHIGMNVQTSIRFWNATSPM
jgi:alpha-glucosidase (family GH31 glycosyl hydrolase)